MTLKLGRRPPKRTASLQLGPLLTGKMPTHPRSVDYLAALHGGWQMLGNDRYGDCVAVTWANVRRLVTATLTATTDYPSLDQVEAFYRTQNPNFPTDDNGMDIQTALEQLVSAGGPDGVKAVAFASVDHTNLAEVKAALAIFGFVWTGINVQKANMDDFNASKPWQYHAGGSINGGHSVLSGGYLGKSADDVRFITWAQETGFTDGFWSHLVEEAWVVIWPEHLGTKEFQAGIDIAKLRADFQAITGRELAA